MSQQIPNGGSDSTVRLKPTAPDDVAQISPQLQPPTTQLSLRPSFDIPHRESSRTAPTTLPNGRQPVLPPSESSPDISDTHQLTTTSSNGGWDSTIGKAGLGKTGRVINKLVSDNESLKRDIKIERLRADESRQAARLLEDKMDRMASEYESRLLEANVTKTLLARKERQVESLTAVVALERAKASSALDRERTWKDEMEKVKAEAKREVEEAHNRAALMEGRYNAIAGHWAEQGREVRAAMAQMKGRVEELTEERRRDDDKIATLREVCDQQDGNIRELARQKEEIARQFERYKAEQERALRDIKTLAARREAEQEAVLRESRDVLDKLKWALNVKENVGWAE
jgi:chromosome segregation ATPase